MTTWRIKRIYEEPSDADGYRVLVDRLWPRGISKKAAHLDEWCKDVAPSTEARRDFGHDPARFGEFKARRGPGGKTRRATGGDAAVRGPRPEHQPGGGAAGGPE